MEFSSMQATPGELALGGFLALVLVALVLAVSSLA